MPKSGMVSLLQMDGSLTEDEFKQALDMSTDACRRIYEMQREALRQKYHIVKDEAETEAATEVKV
jgi:exosome complex component RRP41